MRGHPSARSLLLWLLLIALAAAFPAVAQAKITNGLIAYTTGNGEEEPSAIWTMRPDGTGARLLLGANSIYQAGASGPRWSRDGRWILFRRTLSRDFGGDSLWYMTATGQHRRRIPLPRFGALQGYDWAPDGRRVVVSMMRNLDEAILYTMSRDGTHRRLLRAGANPSWAGDGRHIVFTLMRYRPNEPWASTINVVHPDGSGFRRLSAPNATNDWSPSVSPGGTKVLFSQHVGWAGSWAMVRVDGTDRRAWPNPTVPGGRYRYVCPLQWAPDGTRLVGVRSEDLPNDFERQALVTFNLAGHDEHVVFDTPWPGGCGFSWQGLRS